MDGFATARAEGGSGGGGAGSGGTGPGGRRGDWRAGAGGESPLDHALRLRDDDSPGMVRAALAEGRVALAFQPVMRADGDGRAAFHEGLIRVMDPSGRPIPAADFLPAVAETELGRRLDCVALDLGLRELAAQPGLRLAVNMSARSIGYAPWRQVLEAGIAREPTVAERLILEIGEEQAMLLPDLVGPFLREQQRHGICFALDDFGAGRTSLRQLRDFLFDIVKIDGSLVRGVAGDPDSQVLVQALQAVARHFDLFTVAEAVEVAADAAWLAGQGIDCLQGYFCGAPTLYPPWRGAGRDSRLG